MLENGNFSAPAEEHRFSALLFDMDGTIIDSTAAIIKYWHQIGRDIGVDGDVILQTSHGRRSIDVLTLLAPHLANWDFICQAEGTIPKLYGHDAVEVPGSRALLAALSDTGAPWGIVTSGTRPLVTGWLDAMALARPAVLVTAEEVAKGKPDPQCYRLGARRLGLCSGDEDEGGVTKDPARVLVLEDAAAGVAAGKAAGFKVVALATTHTVESLRAAGADWIVKDMRSVGLVAWDEKTGTIKVRISDALVV